MRMHPKPEMSIPISLAVWHQLLGGSADAGWDKEAWEVAEEAINEWTRRHNPAALAASAMTGYQWKSQFLPHGTVLRTVFGGKNYHCLVEHNHILCNGQPVSPSGFVNAVGGIRRNAWRCTWILFPDSKEWKLADTLRPRSRRARQAVAAVQQTPIAQPSAACAAVPIPPPASPSPAHMQPSANVSNATQPPPHPTHGEPHSNEHQAATTPPPRGYRCGTDRRNNGNDQMAALLRQELLPLLSRMCASPGP